MTLSLTGTDLDPRRQRWQGVWRYSRYSLEGYDQSKRCCAKGHRTPRAALRHAAKEQETWALAFLARLPSESFGAQVLAAMGNGPK